MDKRFEAFRSLLADDEMVEWAGASGMDAGFRWVKWQVAFGILALMAAAGVEPIPGIAASINNTLFGNFGVAPGDTVSGKAFGLDLATVIIRVALAIWAGITLFGAAAIVLSKGREIHLVTDRRVLSLSGSEASAARLSEIESLGLDGSGGQGSLVLNVSGKDAFHMIGLDDPMGALVAISRGMALTKTVMVEVPEVEVDGEDVDGFADVETETSKRADSD